MHFQSQQIISELETVEQQLEMLKKNKDEAKSDNFIDQADSLATNVQTNNDVTVEENDDFVLIANGSLKSSQSGPTVVFPSVKNKPSADSSVLDGAEALLTGVRF